MIATLACPVGADSRSFLESAPPWNSVVSAGATSLFLSAESASTFEAHLPIDFLIGLRTQFVLGAPAWSLVEKVYVGHEPSIKGWSHTSASSMA